MNPPQSYRSPEPLGIRMNAVRLCVALLGFWVVAGTLFLQVQMLALSTPLVDYSSASDISSEIRVTSLEQRNQESSDCCPDEDCSDSQDCSSPCALSCLAPLVAVLDSRMHGVRPRGVDMSTVNNDDGFVQPTPTALFRPPIV